MSHHLETSEIETPYRWPDEPATDDDGQSVLSLVELLLKDPGRLDQLEHDPVRQRELFPRLLLIAQLGYLVYSGVMLLLLNLAPPEASISRLGLPVPPASWTNATGLGLPIGYGLGIVLAACICLPAFYFYSLLAGVRMTWLQITSIVVRGTAANAVMLLGILPIYVAVALGLIVFRVPEPFLPVTLLVGLLLPFAAGLWGLREIYRGVMAAGAELPAPWQCRRRCFLRRLTLSWAAVYTAVVPLLIYRLWESVALWVQ
jgi:hypothetical protein